MQRLLWFVPSLSLVALALVSCAPALERCNSDGECGTRACILGTCVAAPDDAADDGAADLGSAADDRDDGAIGGAGGCDGVRAFVDGDGDGFGAGAVRCERDIAPGLSLSATDCDDNDASAFAARTIYFDGDGDGFTAGSELACIGSALTGARLQRGAPPVHLVEPATVQALQGSWREQALEVTPFAGAAVVRLSQLACAAAAPSAIGHVEVHVRLSASASFVLPSVQVTAALDDGSARTVTAGADGGTVVLGDATFGSGLDPTRLCDGSLAVQLTLATSATLRVETSVLVFGPGEDCDDGDAARFSAALVRSDADGDGFAGGSQVSACLGLAFPEGLGVRARDCDDADADAFPGQTRRFQRARTASGGYDFNCNLVEEPAVVERRHFTDCWSIANGACRHDAVFVTPACGATTMIAERCNAQCRPQREPVTQQCR